MSRIGRKPIPLPKGVTVKIEGNVVAVQGPKGKLDTPLPAGIRVEQQDGNLVAIRENDSQAAVHGLARALVNNAVEGVTKGWTRELEIVGIGYRAELKGKGTVVFSLGYSHPIEYPLPAGIEVAVDPKQTKLTCHAASTARKSARSPPKCAACVRPIRTRTRVCATPASA